MAGDDNGGQRPSGSDKIRDAFQNKGLISEEQVAWLGRNEYGELLDFWVRGQPNPDRFGALIEIVSGREGAFVNAVVEKWHSPFNLQFLRIGSTLVSLSWPHGQPGVEAIPDKR